MDSKEPIFVTYWTQNTRIWALDGLPPFCGCGCCGFETHQAPKTPSKEGVYV
jgi:hypothetical protein